MPPDEKERSLEVEVAGLAGRFDVMQESLEKNNDATAGLQREVSHLRGEINGHLPRIERGIERVHARLDEHRDGVEAVRERAEVHAHEIGTIFDLLGQKVGKAENDEAHAKLWLLLRLSLIAIATAALGALILKAVGA